MRKTSQSFYAVISVAGLMTAISLQAAPIESVESDRASAAMQKIEWALSQDAVVARMTELGLSRERVMARLSMLSEAQLEHLAAQADLVRAGGTIEGAGIPKYNPLRCIWEPFARLLNNIYQLLFCWGPIE